MFSGIIENLGTIKKVEAKGTNKTFTVASPVSKELKVDQSVSHNGVCLTVESCNETSHTVTAVEESLLKTNLNNWSEGTVINIERCITLNSLLDGHLVQGHVDAFGKLIKIENRDGSYNLTIEFPDEFAHLLINKGSISLNGISLTVFNVCRTQFSVTIIPYTWEHTMLYTAKVGDLINLEFDVVGKYIARKLELKDS